MSMSDRDDQVKVTKKKQQVNNDQSAQRSLYGTQSTDSNQSTLTTEHIGDIKIETNNDEDTSNLRQIVRARVHNKNAEYNRLYRERHREKINQRRRDIRQRKNIQNINEIEQNTHETSNNQPSSNSHTQRQQRYYERHREEINKRRKDSRLKKNISQSNKRKRDSRLKQNISRSPPATAAERNRKYRERNKQKINERRRDSRLLQQNKLVHTECSINNIDPIRICEVLMN